MDLSAHLDPNIMWGLFVCGCISDAPTYRQIRSQIYCEHQYTVQILGTTSFIREHEIG